MISLILADAEMERVPLFDRTGEGPVVRDMRGEDLRGIIVFDSSLHRYIVEGLDEAERRGRPDIVHSFLLLVQGSEARRQGKLKAYIHTRGDEVVFVGGRYQPEHDYLTFLRSLGMLLDEGRLGEGDRGLLLERHMELGRLLEIIRPDKVVALTPTGESRDLAKALKPAVEKHLAVIIGGFPEGDYRSPVYELADERVSLGDELLTVPEVTSRVLGSIP